MSSDPEFSFKISQQEGKEGNKVGYAVPTVRQKTADIMFSCQTIQRKMIKICPFQKALGKTQDNLITMPFSWGFVPYETHRHPGLCGERGGSSSAGP